MKAIWNGQILAKSDQTILLEGIHYFPPDAVRREFLLPSDTHTTCPWKGVASYYPVRDAAWYYPEPGQAAQQSKGHITFWKGVQVVES